MSCDVYMTSDKRFSFTIDRVAKAAPFSFAKAVYVEQSADGAVRAIERALDRAPGARRVSTAPIS